MKEYIINCGFVRNGTHYKVVIKGTNTLFDSSTKYGITSQLKINEEVIIWSADFRNGVYI